MAFYTWRKQGYRLASSAPRSHRRQSARIRLAQPFGTCYKILTRKLIPTTRMVPFRLAAVRALSPSLAICAVIPFVPSTPFANIDAGTSVCLALTSMGVYESSSRAGRGTPSTRSWARCVGRADVAYEIAMGFAMSRGIDGVGQLNIGEIIRAQH